MRAVVALRHQKRVNGGSLRMTKHQVSSSENSCNIRVDDPHRTS